MRTTLRTAAPIAALLLALTACGGGTDEADAETDGAAAEEQDDGDAGDDGDGEQATGGEGEGSATVSWQGEEHAYDSTVCDTIVENRFQMRATGADQPDFWVNFDPVDIDDPDADHDFSRGNVEIFFSGEGGTIGDGEGYRTPDLSEAVESDGSSASGSVELEPDDITQAPEVNPDGGTIEFEITCPAA